MYMYVACESVAQEDVPRASGIDEMFADILAPIPEERFVNPGPQAEAC